MNHTTPSKFSRLLQVSLGVSALALSMAAQAQQTGPDPTEASLEKVGPLAVANVKVATPSGYGSGTVYYPTTGSAYGLVSVTPGFVEGEWAINWLGPLLASHGFVVVTIGTNTLFDVPANRAKQMMAALKQVSALSATPTSPFAGKVDPSRLAVMGHSMGGGGSLNAARDNPTLKAAIPLAPWETNKDYSRVTVPTLIVSCDGDIIAPVADHANKFYASLTPTLNRALMEMKDAGHFCTNGTAVPATKTMVGKYSISWLKRFVDGDTRYSPFLCGAPHQADLGGTLISTYKDNCPY
ncbi:MAG: alpha/beta hydrolase [Aquabacterium sp.]|uniref:alpha/beta hydrolase family protein n=1 Tax=Aquabacterium sp. TaxID=1872578 RepID=UPI0027285BDE|nr:alpha/beta hydrolase [Aquabacterium sp.]MDO9004034.1 alpha/beta hydrolase [Aquabacterium sp.]